MSDDMAEPAYVQLCGTFAVELSGRRIDALLPGRQGRLLFAYLALSRLQPVSRDALVDALWGAAPPGNASRRAQRPDLQDAIRRRRQNGSAAAPCSPWPCPSPPGSTSRSPKPGCTKPSRRSRSATGVEPGPAC